MILRWIFDPVLIGGLFTLALLYFLVTGPLRSRYAPGEPYPTRQAILFYFAIVLFYLTEASPLHDFAEMYSFSGHMIQHMSLSYLVSPLMLRGTPAWVLRPLVMNRRVLPIMKVMTKPAVALLSFTMLYSLWHLPPIYEGALGNFVLHHIEHLIFFAFAILFWWPIFSPLKELPRLSPWGRIAYLFMAMIAQLPVFTIITFIKTPLYPTYINSPYVFMGDALQDQVLAGALMKAGALISFGIPIATSFFTWYKESQKGNVYRTRSATLGEVEPSKQV